MTRLSVSAAIVSPAANASASPSPERSITDPRILIFDEATSALDYESERIIQENMRQICAGRTVFIVAHRLSALRQADRIIALERGRLVEDGEPRELMHRGGQYAMLCRAQAGLYEVR